MPCRCLTWRRLLLMRPAMLLACRSWVSRHKVLRGWRRSVHQLWRGTVFTVPPILRSFPIGNILNCHSFALALPHAGLRAPQLAACIPAFACAQLAGCRFVRNPGEIWAQTRTVPYRDAGAGTACFYVRSGLRMFKTGSKNFCIICFCANRKCYASTSKSTHIR